MLRSSSPSSLLVRTPTRRSRGSEIDLPHSCRTGTSSARNAKIEHQLFEAFLSLGRAWRVLATHRSATENSVFDVRPPPRGLVHARQHWARQHRHSRCLHLVSRDLDSSSLHLTIDGNLLSLFFPLLKFLSETPNSCAGALFLLMGKYSKRRHTAR